MIMKRKVISGDAIGKEFYRSRDGDIQENKSDAYVVNEHYIQYIAKDPRALIVEGDLVEIHYPGNDSYSLQEVVKFDEKTFSTSFQSMTRTQVFEKTFEGKPLIRSIWTKDLSEDRPYERAYVERWRAEDVDSLVAKIKVEHKKMIDEVID